jgi:cell division protein ZapA
MQDEMVMQEEPVSVEIYDQIYTLRGTDAAYIEHLAGVVDAKMRAVAEQGNTVDSLRVAVLASLNIADELACLRERYASLSGAVMQTETMRSRSASLSGMLDQVLEEFEHEPVRRAG